MLELLDDPTVTCVRVHRFDDVMVERFETFEQTGRSFFDEDHLLAVIKQIADLLGTRLDCETPLLDHELPGGHVQAMIPPIAQPGATLTIVNEPHTLTHSADLFRVSKLNR